MNRSTAHSRKTAIRLIAVASALVLTLAACGDSGTDTAPAATPAATAAPTTVAPTTSVTAPSGTASFAITAVSFSGGFVEITNVGNGSGSLEGFFLCQRPSYHSIGAIDLAPGESTQVAAAGGSFGSLDAGSGEVGLYNTSSFGSASAIESYVEWGASGHGRSGTAVEAGIWTDGGFVATDGSTGGLTSDGATSPDGWSAG